MFLSNGANFLEQVNGIPNYKLTEENVLISGVSLQFYKKFMTALTLRLGS